MKYIKVKPAEGRACPVPEKGNELLPVAGDNVPHNAYWQRRLDAGDAVLVEPKKAAKESKE